MPQTEGWPEGARLPLTKLLGQHVLATGLHRLHRLLGPGKVVLEGGGQLVPQHCDVGERAVQVQLGCVQGWAAHKGPLAPATHPSSDASPTP